MIHFDNISKRYGEGHDALLNVSFELDAVRKNNLKLGLDDIGQTMQHTDRIDEYETKHQSLYPWLWSNA